MKIVLFSLLLALSAARALHAQTDSIPPVLGGIVINDSIYKSGGPVESGTRSSSPGGRRSVLEGRSVVAPDQGLVPGCGCYAIAWYLAIRLQKYCDHLCKARTPFVELSASFLHNLSLKQPGGGIHLKNAFDILLQYGICRASVFPNDRHSAEKMPDKKAYDDALRYRVWTRRRIFYSRAEVPDPEKYRQHLIESTIAQLDNDIPVVVALLVGEDFRSLPAGRCRYSPASPAIHGHAVLVTGYDDKKQEFEFLNFYGPGWGCKGFGRIGYEDFKRLVKEGWIIKFSGKEPPCSRP